MKDQAKQCFTDTDYAFKLYKQIHQNEQITVPKAPKFSDFYQPSKQQKDGELMFIGVVVNFLSQVIFIFPLFLGMVIYANKFKTKEKQKLPEIKN